MQGCVDLCYVKADRPGIEPVTCKSQVQRPTAEPPRHIHTYLYAVSEHWLGAASRFLIDLDALDAPQEDEVQIGVEFEVAEQRRRPGRRIDGIGQRRRGRPQRKPEDGPGVVAGRGESVLVAAEESEVRVELVAGGLEQRRPVAGQGPRVAAGAVEELLMRVEDTEVVAAKYTRQIYKGHKSHRCQRTLMEY